MGSSDAGQLDTKLNVGLAALGISGIIGAVVWLGGKSMVPILVVSIAVAFVALMILKLMQRMRRRRQAEKGDEEIYERIRATPGRVSDPEKLGRIAALSVKLEEVVKRYKELGHSLSDEDLPWFLLVGETGSGKSEAIRHSGIGFPPGMNNEQQGSGGTLNMDWWFTENGIILDTAGRLLIEQDETQSLDELQRFLQFVRKVRPACPINGMLLVIPADSLIKDSVDVITDKSGIIAKRLDLMRRSLGIRFPVYVVITKSD